MAYRSPYPDITVPNIDLFEQVFSHAHPRPGAIAMADGLTGRTISYESLLEQIRQTAAGLAARGIGKGDVVSLWSPNVPEWPVVFFAVVKLGAIVHASNPVSTPEELSFQLKDGDAKMLFTVSALVDKAKAAIQESGKTIELFTIDETPGVPTLASLAIDQDPPAVTIDPANDLCVLPYSSGTTGLPKGVMLTHRNLVAQLHQIDSIESVETPALLGVLPFFHIYGMVILVMHGLMRGSTIVTMPKFEFEPFLKVLQDWPIVTAHIVPPIVVGLGKHPAVDNYKFPHLRFLFSGAAPLGPELTDAVEKRLNVKIRQGYGMTEASPATHYTVAGFERSGTAGRLMPSIEMRMISPETGKDVPSGEPGEVWVRGPNVMKGYLNNPEATARTVDADGWLHTGDIGIADDDGYLTVVDRLKELIKVKGFQVAPAELESLLLKHPQIADVAVIPVADEHSGEVPKAIVVKRDSLTAEDVIAYLKPKVAHYKCVKHVAFVDAIPKSPSGKILRRVLVERERTS
ncbi:MAG: 4-coumarate--CoA ligase family protein [Acidimicrobiia bacterium]|nr:4-coumarate--CoA ligase family protein [Acidimicrobiia bacterium]